MSARLRRSSRRRRPTSHLLVARAARAAVRPGHASGRSASPSATACVAGSGRVNGRAVCAWAQDGTLQGRLAGRRRRRDDRAHDRSAPTRSACRSSASRTPAARGCRRASAALHGLRGDLPRAVHGDGAADQRHRRAVRGRRRLLARARRPDDHGRPDGADVPDRAAGGRGASRARRSPPRSSAARRCTAHNGVAHCSAERRRRRPPSSTRALLSHLPSQIGDALPLHPPRDAAGGRPAATCARRAARGLRRARRRRAPRRRRRAARARPRWARNLVVGFARIEGSPVGVIANQPRHLGGCLDAAASEKGAWFVNMCDRFGLPLVVLVDTPGVPAGCTPGAGRGHSPRRRAAASVRRRDRPARDGHAAPGVRRRAHRHELPRPRRRPSPWRGRDARIGVMGAAQAVRAGRAPRDRRGRRRARRWPTPTRASTCRCGSPPPRGFVDEIVAPLRDARAHRLRAGGRRVTPAAARRVRRRSSAQRDRGGDPRRGARRRWPRTASSG